MPERTKLVSLRLAGFRSIAASGQHVTFGDTTVLIGANGAGKSNLVAFLNLLGYMMTEALQVWVGRRGGADATLFYGAKRTDSIEFSLQFEQGTGEGPARTEYRVRLAFGAGNNLFVEREKVLFHKPGAARAQEYALASGGPEIALPQDPRSTSKILSRFLGSIHSFQFHDTSEASKIRIDGYADDCRYLRSDGGNTAAMLRRMRQDEATQKHYSRIVRHVARVMPQFGDFVLDDAPGKRGYVRLDWKGRDGESLFGAHQLSDGSLRFIALATLFLQPPEWMPGVIVVDEPELGLHPAAVAELFGMMRSAAAHAQIVIATQSAPLVDLCTVSDIVVVEREGEPEGTAFRRLDAAALAEWIDRYSLSELWDKNVLGARP